MAFDLHSNFGYSTVLVAPAPALTGLSLTLAAGGGALMPAAPFNCTVWPTGTGPLSTNAEIVRVTAKAGDVLTIVRAQEGSSARSILVGDQFANSITVKVFTDIEAKVVPFVAGTDGIVTAPVAATGKFLRDDNTFQTPAGGGGGTGLLLGSLVYFGTATLNEVFGFLQAPAATTISRIQIAAQTIPSGSAINVTLVNAAGVSWGSVGVLADGAAYQETLLGAPLVLAGGDVVRAKLTLVDGTGGYLTVNLL